MFCEFIFQVESSADEGAEEAIARSTGEYLFLTEAVRHRVKDVVMSVCVDL